MKKFVRKSLKKTKSTKIEPAVHDIDPDTELAPWFMSGMTQAETETTETELLKKGGDGSFIMLDLDMALPRAVQRIKVKVGSALEEFVVEKAPAPQLGFRIRGSTSKNHNWDTLYQLATGLATEVIPPLAVKLDMVSRYLDDDFPTQIQKRRQSRRESVTSIGSYEFGFGDEGQAEQDANMVALENAVKLRKMFRTDSRELETTDRIENMSDPFWAEREEEMARNDSFNNREQTEGERWQVAQEEETNRRRRSMTAKTELKKDKKELMIAKRRSAMRARPESQHDGEQPQQPQQDDSAVDDLIAMMMANSQDNENENEDENDENVDEVLVDDFAEAVNVENDGAVEANTATTPQSDATLPTITETSNANGDENIRIQGHTNDAQEHKQPEEQEEQHEQHEGEQQQHQQQQQQQQLQRQQAQLPNNGTSDGGSHPDIDAPPTMEEPDNTTELKVKTLHEPAKFEVSKEGTLRVASIDRQNPLQAAGKLEKQEKEEEEEEETFNVETICTNPPPSSDSPKTMAKNRFRKTPNQNKKHEEEKYKEKNFKNPALTLRHLKQGVGDGAGGGADTSASVLSKVKDSDVVAVDSPATQRRFFRAKSKPSPTKSNLNSDFC